MKAVIAAAGVVFFISFAANAATAEVRSRDDARVHAGRFGFIATEEPTRLRVEGTNNGQATVTEVTRVVGIDASTGTDRVLTSVRVTSPSGELLYAEETVASPAFDAAPATADEDRTGGDRRVAAAAASTSPSIQSLINALGTYVQTKNIIGILTSIKKLQTYLVDKALAPVVKNVFQQHGYVCAPVPRWWPLTDTMWYMFTCFGVAS